jgi:hypothetical protein
MRNVFLFNPTCEMAIANDTVSYMPPAHLRKFESDISALMGFAGSGNDYLISDNKNETSLFFDSMAELGFDLPKMLGFENIGTWNSGEIKKLSPWGWSRAAHRILSPLKPFCSNSFINSPVSQWKASDRNFYSRRTSVGFLAKVKSKAKSLNYISIPYSPFVVDSMEEIERWMSVNTPPYVFKTPWSSSGRGLYPVLSDEFVKRSEVWVRSRLKQQKELIVEPWLKKIQDFSFQFYIHSDGEIDFLGVNYFEADEEGNFEKEYIGFPQNKNQKAVLKNLPVSWVTETKELLLETIREHAFEKHYCGPVGIDGVIFRDENEIIKVHPCIEINFRYNMGRLNLEIEKKLQADAVGVWKIKQFKPGEWNVFVKQNVNNNPAQMSNGKVISGFLPLVPYSGKQLFGAWAVLV